MLQDFQKFLIKGNAVDMAVGFIFGAAFGTVIKSFVSNIMMPPLGLLTGNVDFSKLEYVIIPAAEEAEAVAIKYGVFINDAIAFIILGFAIFLIVRMINDLQKKEEEKPAPAPKKSDELQVLEEIRDTMKKHK